MSTEVVCLGKKMYSPHRKVHPLRTQSSDEIVLAYPSTSSFFVEESELLLQKHDSVVGQSGTGIWNLAEEVTDEATPVVSKCRHVRWENDCQEFCC